MNLNEVVAAVVARQEQSNEMREHRKKLGLTQAAYAKLLKIALPTVKAIEYGKLPMSMKMASRMMLLSGDSGQAVLRNFIDQRVAEYRAKLERELLVTERKENEGV